MRKAPVRIVDLDPREIEAALAQAKTALPEPTYRILATVVEAYRFILEQLARNRASIGACGGCCLVPRVKRPASF